MIKARCLVFNSSYEFIHVSSLWRKTVNLVHKGRAHPLAVYDDITVRSERMEIPLPAVVVLNKYANVGRRRHIFAFPSKRNVLVREGFKCAYCGRGLTLASCTKDHVLPTSKGGKDTLENVVAACGPCNFSKANRTPAEAGMTLRVHPRPLTDEERIQVLVKTHKAHERNAWMSCLRKNGLRLF